MHQGTVENKRCSLTVRQFTEMGLLGTAIRHTVFMFFVFVYVVRVFYLRFILR